MNLMLINVSTRKLRRAVRLPEGDLPVIAGDGTSKSAASRRFVALSAERLAAWMASDLSKLDLLIIHIDGLHIGNDLVPVAALGIDGNGERGLSKRLSCTPAMKRNRDPLQTSPSSRKNDRSRLSAWSTRERK